MLHIERASGQRLLLMPLLLLQVPFDKSMAPTGSVEIWLGEVERRMIASVRTQVWPGAGNGTACVFMLHPTSEFMLWSRLCSC
jgi:hypothetical protein